MNYEEHLRWCKQRALEYVDQGDLKSAVASIGSDLGKHAETRRLVDNPYHLLLGMQYVLQYDVAGVRKWIEGFR